MITRAAYPSELTEAAEETRIMPKRPLTVATISDYSSFLKLAPVWDRLHERTGIEHPFVSHEWIKIWWECFGQDKRLHILLVRAYDEILAIVPLMWSRADFYGLPVSCLESIHNYHTPRFDWIIGHSCDDIYRAVWTSLKREPWDVFRLCKLPESSPTPHVLQKLAGEEEFPWGLWNAPPSPYVPLAHTWENYLGTLSNRHRSNLKNRFRRLRRLGEVKLEVISDGHLHHSLREGFSIEAAAWKGTAGTAIVSEPEVQRFYFRLAEQAAAHGWLRLCFLTVGGRRIAFGYSVAHNKRLYMLKCGYDPNYRSYSPFHLLCYLLLQEMFEQGFQEFDLLGEDEPWKLQWTPYTRAHRWLFVFPDTLRGRAFRAAKFRFVPWLKRTRAWKYWLDRRK